MYPLIINCPFYGLIVILCYFITKIFLNKYLSLLTFLQEVPTKEQITYTITLVSTNSQIKLRKVRLLTVSLLTIDYFSNKWKFKHIRKLYLLIKIIFPNGQILLPYTSNKFPKIDV